MTNGEKFKEVFGLYATETWAMPESDFLLWLNGEYSGEERKVGRWISDNPFVKKITIDENGYTDHSCHCSECGDWLTGSDEYACRGYYCPNCGLKMEADAKPKHPDIYWSGTQHILG